MKRLFILIVVGLAIAISLSFAVLHDPGYVRISIGHWLIESNLWVMIAINVIILIIFAAFFKLLRQITDTTSHFSSWLGNTSSKRTQQQTEKGLIALLEGNWSSANKLLSRSASKSKTPLINYLAAAHAANELGDLKGAEQLIKKAYESTADSEFAVGVAQAQIQLQQNRLEQCLATLLRLRKQQLNHPFILKLLKTVYLRLEDWQQLINLIPALKKGAIIDKESLLILEKQAWNNLFIQKSDELEHLNQQNTAAQDLAALWKKIPDELRFDTSLIETYARQLLRLKNDDECEVLLRKMLRKHWSDTLITLYGEVTGNNPSEQLLHAENWLKEKPDNAALLLTLGRLSLRKELWGKALEYFKASNRLQATAQSYAELCRLSIRMNKNSQDNEAIVSSLISSLELPDLPLPKKN